MQQQNLCHLLIHLGDQETQIEEFRLYLVQNEYFTLYRAFQAFDVNHENFITEELIGIPSALVIQYYCEYKSNRLVFANFINLCLPRTNAKLRQEQMAKQERTILPEQQEMIKEHLKILIQKEQILLEQLKEYGQYYQIDFATVFTYPLRKMNLQRFLDCQGFSCNVEPIWNRLNVQNKEFISLEDMSNIFVTNDQPMKLKEVPIYAEFKSQKLGWMEKGNCAYHQETKRDRINDFSQFIKSRQVLKNYETKLLRKFLYLIKEHASIYKQIDKIKEKLNKYDLREIFDLIGDQNVLDFPSLQKLLGPQFYLDKSDFLKLARYLNGYTFDSFQQTLLAISKGKQLLQMDQIRVVLIKLILLLQLSSYLRRQFRGKSLIRGEDIIGEFGSLGENDFIKMGRQLKVELSLEEIQVFFKNGSVLNKEELMSFLEDV